MSRIRKPAVAGMFYPSNPQKLRGEIETILSITPHTDISGKIFGIIVPHAGYIYSGRTAAFAFRLLKGTGFKTVIIISPSHREYFSGVSVYDGDAFETPLGIIETDKEISEKLCKGAGEIFKSEIGHRAEHAIEVELPFLQAVLDDFKIVPVVMGEQKPKYINELAGKIADVYNEDILVVASSDLSHYHTREQAAEMDGLFEQRINDFEYEKLLIDLELRNCEACGGGPVVSLMKAAALKKFNKSTVLRRTDSGETSGITSEVVGYLSAAIHR